MTERPVVVLVVIFVGLCALATVLVSAYLIAVGKEAPGELWGFGGTALGGLVGLLASTRTKPAESSPTAVIQDSGPTNVNPGPGSTTE